MATGYITTTVRVSEDSSMEIPKSWADPTQPYGGYRLWLGDGNEVIVWIDWEAIPRLCHLLTELYARRPQAQMSDAEAVAMFLREDR